MVQDGITLNPGIDQPVNIQPSSNQKVQVSSQPVISETPQEEAAVPISRKLDPELLKKVTEDLNENFRIFNTTINFSIDETSGNTVIKIMDRETEKVVREIPPEQLLELASRLAEIIGRIVDETA